VVLLRRQQTVLIGLILVLTPAPAQGQPILFAGSTSLTGPNVAGGTGSLAGATGTVIDNPMGYTYTAVDLTYTAGAGDINQLRSLHWNLNRYAYISATVPVFPQDTTALDGTVTYLGGMQIIGIRQAVSSFNQFPDLNLTINTSSFMQGIANPFNGSASKTAATGTTTAAGPWLTDGYIDFMPLSVGATLELRLPSSSSSSLFVAVPEPSSLLLCVGSVSVVMVWWKRWKSSECTDRGSRRFRSSGAR
jgi:hypothetical protein